MFDSHLISGHRKLTLSTYDSFLRRIPDVYRAITLAPVGALKRILKALTILNNTKHGYAITNSPFNDVPIKSVNKRL
jgi:hypothetical protein